MRTNDNTGQYRGRPEAHAVPPPHSMPSGVWREQYECRRNKGPHEYELVKPRYLDHVQDIRKMTVAEYYEREEKRRLEAIQSGRYCSFAAVFGYPKHWQCIHCGHEETETLDRQNKRIQIRK